MATRRVDAVLLAAGESTRMGQPKAALPWLGQPLLAYNALSLLASPIERIAVVLGHRADELTHLVPHNQRIALVRNDHYRLGKVSSIVAGIAALAEAGDLLIIGADQPRPAALITDVVAAHIRSQAPITVAGYHGRGGHPVLFAAQLRGELLTIDEASQGLRAVMRRHAASVHLHETGSPLALVNLNTPEDYAVALQLLAPEAPEAPETPEAPPAQT